MIPCIGVTIGDTEYYPLYNNNAMFRIQDFDRENPIRDMLENSEAGWDLAFELFHILCEEGKAQRERYGYEPCALPEKEEMMPGDIVKIKNAVIMAVTVGSRQDVPDLEDVDLVLLELQKKTDRK